MIALSAIACAIHELRKWPDLAFRKLKTSPMTNSDRSASSLYCTPLEPILAKIPNDLPRAARVVMQTRIVRIGVRGDSKRRPAPPAGRRSALAPFPLSMLFLFSWGDFLKIEWAENGARSAFT